MASQDDDIYRMASAWKLDIESRQLEMYAVANADALAMLEVAMITAGLDIGAVSLGGTIRGRRACRVDQG